MKLTLIFLILYLLYLVTFKYPENKKLQYFAIFFGLTIGVIKLCQFFF